MSRVMQQFPPELGGARDLSYVHHHGRRMSEYEAVTCHTQPGSPAVGGMQAAGTYVLRPDGRPCFDVDSTHLRCDDWYAFRDPNQMWQRLYYVAQAQAERSIEHATEVALSSDLLSCVDLSWVTALAEVYLPFSHLEYGLFRTLNPAAREALSDTVSNVLIFNAADKLRHAQAIAILGLDLEEGLPGFSRENGRHAWLNDDLWQPVRRLTEEMMAITDWCEAIVAVNLAMEPLLCDPLRRVVLTLCAARHGDVVVPQVTSTATADWHRNSKWTVSFLEFIKDAAPDNRAWLKTWAANWSDNVRAVARELFSNLAHSLDDEDIASRAEAMGQSEHGRHMACLRS